GMPPGGSNWKTTWILPSGGTACANTGGSDRPNSAADGSLPSTAGGFLQYRPSSTATDLWNQDINYDGGAGSCPAFSTSNEGTWKLRLDPNSSGDTTHFVVLPVFTVDARVPSSSATSPTYSSSSTIT